MFGRHNLEDAMLRTIAVVGTQTCVTAALKSLNMIQDHSQLLRSKSNIYNLHRE